MVSSMVPPESFRSIIELWDTREALASDIGASAWAVSKWWQRDAIPAEWWAAVLGCSRVREAGITAEKMMTLAARPELTGTIEARP